MDEMFSNHFLHVKKASNFQSASPFLGSVDLISFRLSSQNRDLPLCMTNLSENSLV